MNIPLIESLEKNPGYAKLMKDLVNKKRMVSFKPIDNRHHCNDIASRSLVEKKEDPKAFKIPYTIGSFNFVRALDDLGASINLMSLVINKQLGSGSPNSTSMSF